MAVRIGHASIDENSRAHSGKAGDQTGKECKISNWYSKPWLVVLRPKSSSIAEKSARACEKLCACNLVGYDQYERNTLHTQLKKVGYNVDAYIASGIRTETDCSAFQTVLAILAGVTELEYSNNALVCSTMKNAYKNTGKYEVLTDSKYLNSSDYLKRGDVLVGSGHTVMVLDNGSKANASEPNKPQPSKPSKPSQPQSGPSYSVGSTYTLQVELKVRTGPGTNYGAKKHSELTADGRKHDTDKDGALEKGTRVTCKEIKQVGSDIWMRTPSGWLAAYYKGNLYIK